MFDLKPIERKVDCAFEESEHQTQCETGVNGRAKVTYVFFARAQ